MVGLLKMIRNITHNQDETKHSAMPVVECDLELMLGFQEKHQSLNEFMRFVLAKCDTIKACGGEPSIHMGLYAIAVTEEKEAVGVSTSDFAAWDQEERRELFEIAKKALCQ